MKLSRNVGAAVLGGAMALGACGGTQPKAKSPSQKEIPKQLLDIRGPADGENKQEKVIRKPYLSPPKNMGEFMDVYVICAATHEAPKAFVRTEAKIPSTKGCRLVQAIHDQGENLVEACTPVIESKLPTNIELLRSIATIRSEIESIRKQMLALRNLNAHCFGDKVPEPPVLDLEDFKTADQTHS